MSVLNNLLRCGLAAAFWTILAGAPAPAAADDQPAKTPATSADREQVEQQLRSISEKIGRLDKEAEGLKHEARALYGKLNPHSSDAASLASAERAQLYQQVRTIRDKINQATKDGNQDEVQRLNKEFEALRSKLYAQSGHASTRPSAGGDRDARLQHLRSAAENLKAAGFEPEAQHVMQLASRIQGEGSAATPPSGSSPSSQGYGNSPAVQELRSQVEQMHRELRELRAQLKGTKSSQ